MTVKLGTDEIIPLNPGPEPAFSQDKVTMMATKYFMAFVRDIGRFAYRHFPWLLAMASMPLIWRQLCSTL